MRIVLRLEDIRLSFTDTHNETLDLFCGVNLDVELGKITALVGGNGTGKTTLFNVISGFQKDYSGSIFSREVTSVTSHHIKYHVVVLVVSFRTVNSCRGLR